MGEYMPARLWRGFAPTSFPYWLLAIPYRLYYHGLMTQTRTLAYLAIIGNVIIWGAALPLVKPALTFISPYNFLLLRYLVASFFMVPVIFIFWPKHFSFKLLGLIAGLEFLQVGLSLAVLYQGLAYTSALTAAFISSTAPIFVTLGGIIFLKERQERHEWTGLMLSVTGTVIIIFSSFLLNGSAGSTSLKGVSLILIYVLADMAYLLLAKKYYPHLNKAFITAVSCFVGLISYLIITPLVSPMANFTTIMNHPEIVRAVLYMGILGSPFAVGLYLWGQSKIEASEAAVFTYLQPLIYIPLSVLWLGDRLHPYQPIGLMFIILGVFITEKRRKK
jgi:drug/metabolite transporter (DMT)-like permease